MNRREFVSIAGSATAMFAGCIDPPANDGSDDEDDGDDDGGLSVVGYDFAVVPSHPKHRMGGEPPVIDNVEEGNDTTTVTIYGVIVGQNGCMEAAVTDEPAVDGNDISTGVGMVYGPDDEDVSCPQVVVEDPYELKIEFTGMPDAIVVNHADMEDEGEGPYVLELPS